jgi:hypothetical protein
MFRDWAWINDAMSRIERDRAVQNIRQLDSLFAAMQTLSGNVEPFQKLRNSFLTPQMRGELEDLEKARIKEAKAKGGGITPRRRKRAEPEPDMEKKEPEPDAPVEPEDTIE